MVHHFLVYHCFEFLHLCLKAFPPVQVCHRVRAFLKFTKGNPLETNVDNARGFGVDMTFLDQPLLYYVNGQCDLDNIDIRTTSQEASLRAHIDILARLYLLPKSSLTSDPDRTKHYYSSLSTPFFSAHIYSHASRHKQLNRLRTNIS